jgi:hypothetical protein
MVRRRKVFLEPALRFLAVLLMTQVPHVGILTNGTLWVFVRYDENTKSLVKSVSYNLPLSQETTTEALQAAALHIVERIVMLLQDQKTAVDEMTSARAAKRPATSC